MGKKVMLSENATKICEARYFMEGANEDWEKLAQRSAVTMAASEKERSKYEAEFFDMIYPMDFIPAGRTLRNAGRPKGSMVNCYALPVGDSIEEIGEFMKNALILWSEGGGVGCNFSPLRPKGDPIAGKGGTSSGLVSFLEATDSISMTIESGGQRRAAGLACAEVYHPEIIDFINAKLVDGRISHFNISVVVFEEFLKAVESNSMWTFKFQQKEYGSVPARDIWNLIITNMINKAEPGLLNGSNLFKNNSYYFDPVLTTNPCGEVPLSAYGACCLGSLVLPNFITGTTNTNWRKLEQVIKTAVRFLDNVLDANKYTLKEVDIKAHNTRRIGIGVMGLAEYLFAKELRYGSEKAIFEVDRLFKFIRDAAYYYSVELAREKGAFPKFDPVQYGNASFVRKLPVDLRSEIKKSGIRNCTILACAPTGTTALIPEVSSGIEPLIFKSYKRHDRVGDRVYIHPMYRNIIASGQETPDWFVDSGELTAKDHLETQRTIQKYIDGSVSKTINFQKGVSFEEISDLILEYIYDLKGVTIYVDGSREGQVYNRMTEEEVREYLKNNSELASNEQK